MPKQSPSPHERASRVCIWDIESTSLNATFGFVLCVGWKWLGEKKVHIAKTTDFGKNHWDDKGVVMKAVKEISEADMWVTWYGSRFDVPFLNTRLILHGKPPMPPIAHWDGWRVARNHLKMSSNRLATISEFFGLSPKTPVRGDAWVKASVGHGPSLKYVVDHCVQDVLTLEQAYLKLRPLTKDHPNLGIFNKEMRCCPACQSVHIHKRGTRIARSRAYQRYQCDDCGLWLRARVAMRIPPPDVI